MSIQNLLNTDINSFNVSCTVGGAITGTIIMNFKRLDNVVYMTFSTLVGTANNTIAEIFITPSETIPNKYVPYNLYQLALVEPITVYNNSTNVMGTLISSPSFNQFTLRTSPSVNFNGDAGFSGKMINYIVNSV